MKRLVAVAVALVFLSISCTAQEIIKLYPGAIPNAKPSSVKETANGNPPQMYRGVTEPTLQAFLPEGNATGTGVIIIPGGSYAVVVYEGEGVRTAKELAKLGIAAFVLKYRLPNDTTMVDKSVGPLQDAQQAVKLVREHAEQWHLLPNKIGIMGFSAGGHLASTEATHCDTPYVENANHTSLRPDFVVLVYPVISMRDSLTHRDSRTNLLGPNPSKEAIERFSNELQVTETTPPTYLTHAGDDGLVDVDNSISFYEALRHHRVPAELHLYPKGGHGFVLRQKPADWLAPMVKWLGTLH